jgi:nitroreductase
MVPKAEWSAVLDKVLKSRRSVRFFKPDIPSRKLIKEVISAGLLAPYAAQALGDEKDFRRFVVIPRDSRTMSLVAERIRSRVRTMYEELKREMADKPLLQTKAGPFADKLGTLSREGVIGVGTAPYYIVVAERKGIPPVEQQSLAHCLQNMWLKATSLGLGFHLVSATAQMSGDDDFCDMLGLPCDEFELNGCAVGYPIKAPPPASRPRVDKVTTWML